MVNEEGVTYMDCLLGCNGCVSVHKQEADRRNRMHVGRICDCESLWGGQVRCFASVGRRA